MTQPLGGGEAATLSAEVRPEVSRRFGRSLTRQLTAQTRGTFGPAGASAGGAWRRGFSSAIAGSNRAVNRSVRALARPATLAAQGVGLAAGAALGVGIARGTRRLATIQTAEKQLRTMGVTAKETTQITSELSDVLMGTAFGMDEATSAATRLIASGSEVSEVTNQVKMLTDAAAFGGSSVGELANLFARIQGEGRITAETLNMMTLRVPGFTSAMAEAANVTESEFREMATDVSAERFISLWEKAAKSGSVTWEGMAKDMDDTLIGAGQGVLGWFDLHFASFIKDSGLWDFMNESLQNIKSTMEDPAFADRVTEIGEAFGDWVRGIDWQQLIQFFVDLGSVVKTWGDIIRPIANVLLPILAQALGFLAEHGQIVIHMLAAFVVAVKLITAAQWLWNAAMAANPLGLIVIAIAAVVGGILWLWHNVEGFRNFILAAWDVIATASLWLWNHAIKPAFEAIRNVIMNQVVPAVIWLWENVISVYFGLVRAYVMNVLWPVFQFLWEGIKLAFNAIATIVSAWWNNIVRPVFNLVVAILRNVVVPAFQFLWQQISATITNVINIINFLWENVVRPVWNLIANLIRILWENVIKPAWDAMVAGIQVLIDWVSTLWNNIQDFVGRIIDKFQEMQARIEDAFSNILSIASDIWNSIAETIHTPIAFVIEDIYNNGLRKLVVDAADAIGLSLTLPSVPVPELPTFHTGGLVPGDASKEVVAKLLGGERVLSHGEMEAMGGPAGVDRMVSSRGQPGVGGPFDWLGDAWDTVTDAASDFAAGMLGPVFEQAVESFIQPLIDRIPSSDVFPGNMAKASAEKMVDGILNYLTGKDEEHGPATTGRMGAEGLVSGGGEFSGGYPVGWQAKLNWIQNQVPGTILRSGPRPGDWGYHGVGQAIDMGFPDRSEYSGGGLARQAFNVIKAAFFPSIRELIWDFAGDRAVWNGQNHFFTGPTAGPGTHADHIHWADNMAGTWLGGGWNHVLNTTGQPEAVLPAQTLSSILAADRSRGSDGSTADGGPIVIQSHLYLDGQEIDHRVETIMDGHDRDLAQYLDAR